MKASLKAVSVAALLLTAGFLAQAQTTSTAAAPVVGTSTASTEEKASSPFGVTYYFIGGQTLGDNPSSFDIFDSYISFNYKVSRDLKFSARPTFGYGVEGTNKYGDDVDNKARIRDFSFVMAMTNVAEDFLPATMSLKTAPRVYLPTSDDSKEQGLIARLRIENELRWNLSKDFDLSIYAKPSYFFQRSTTYLTNSNPKKPNSLKTTAMADSEHGTELSYSLGKYFSIKPGLNFIDKWSNGSGANDLEAFHSSVVDYRLGLEVRASRQISFTLGLQSEQDLINTAKPRELSYSILTGGTIF